MQRVAVLASGMVTAVGLNAPSSCAAIRCGIDNFTETRFMDQAGEWIVGAQVPLEQPWRGLPKLVRMIVPALRECLAHTGSVPPREIPLLLAVAEKDRPGRLPGLDDELLQQIQSELGLRFHPRSGVIPQGRVAGALAMGAAREMISAGEVSLCLIAGVDSYLLAPTLAAFEDRQRLLTSQNSNGFIPGEAGCALLVGKVPTTPGGALICYGAGSGHEQATIDSEQPLRADGLVQAVQAAFADAARTYEQVDYRLTDANGEQYWFKEAALALTRTLRQRKEQFDLWHPADCIGDVGAATVPCVLSVAQAAAAKAYAPGPGVLCHFSSDGALRMALVCGTEGGLV